LRWPLNKFLQLILYLVCLQFVHRNRWKGFMRRYPFFGDSFPDASWIWSDSPIKSPQFYSMKPSQPFQLCLWAIGNWKFSDSIYNLLQITIYLRAISVRLLSAKLIWWCGRGWIMVLVATSLLLCCMFKALPPGWSALCGRRLDAIPPPREVWAEMAPLEISIIILSLSSPFFHCIFILIQFDLCHRTSWFVLEYWMDLWISCKNKYESRNLEENESCIDIGTGTRPCWAFWRPHVEGST
jgi:hypothetical protein